MNKNNKKGFTLVELLAVIVVLALIMVLTVPTILTQMENAQKKSFIVFSGRVINKAIEKHAEKDLVGTPNFGTVKNDTALTNKNCFNLTQLGFQSEGSYTGFVTIETEGATTTYKLYLKDKKYMFNGVESSAVLNATDATPLSGFTTGNCEG